MNGAVVRRKLVAAARPRTWLDAGIEGALRTAPYRARRELSFPVDPTRLQGVRIEWPAAYRWPPTSRWLDPLRVGLARFVPVERVPLAQPATPVVMLRVTVGGAVHDVGVDYSDYLDLDEATARSVPLYVKLQHRRGGYGIPAVVPGGYLPHSDALYGMLGGLRRIARRPSRRRVFGRFSPNNEQRRRAVDLLERQQDVPFVGGLALRRYGAYLAAAAASAVSLDMPGRGPLCFRLVDYLAAGCCIVAPPHEAELHVPLVDGVHIAYTRPDLSDLADVCRRLLDDEDARRRLRANAADYFDRYLERRQLAAYFLHHVVARLSD